MVKEDSRANGEQRGRTASPFFPPPFCSLRATEVWPSCVFLLEGVEERKDAEAWLRDTFGTAGTFMISSSFMAGLQNQIFFFFFPVFLFFDKPSHLRQSEHYATSRGERKYFPV